MALYRALNSGWQVKYLVTLESENPYSYMFHVPNIQLTPLLAEALKIPLIRAHTPGEKEKELSDLKMVLEELKEEGVDAIFSGALASTYQKSRIDHLCQEIGLQSCAPLWEIDPLLYMDEVVNSGFKVMIISVSAEGLDQSWLGRIIDKKVLAEIKVLHKKYGIHPAFEGGEAETLVLDGPIFYKKLNIIDSKIFWHGDGGYLDIDAVLIDK